MRCNPVNTTLVYNASSPKNYLMKKIFSLILLLYSPHIFAQELFVFTEPASNMAAKSVGFRLNNTFGKNTETNKKNYQLSPEIMWGVSRKMMVHATAYLNDYDTKFTARGASFYVKYRLLSVDDIHNHFRLSAFGRYSFNNSIIQQPAIDLEGFNSGYEGGVVATQLINKVALSATSFLSHAMDNGNQKFLLGDKARTAVNYTLSIGKLMLPKEYTNYKQTNLNLMVELLGQTNLQSGLGYLDIAPAAQLIINSRSIIDLGYRYAMIKNLTRTSPQGIFIRFEYNIFNIY